MLRNVPVRARLYVSSSHGEGPRIRLALLRLGGEAGPWLVGQVRTLAVDGTDDADVSNDVLKVLGCRVESSFILSSIMSSSHRWAIE